MARTVAEAVGELQGALRAWPADKTVAARLANLLSRMGRTTDAIATLEQEAEFRRQA